MRVRTTSVEATSARRAWLVGGVLLIASAILPGVLQPLGWLLPGFGFMEAGLLAASFLVFAFGFRRQGSVTALRPLGTTALACLAATIVATSVVSSLLADQHPSLQMAVANAFTLIQAALAMVAVLQIGRGGVVPAPWNWAPAWCLAATAIAWLLYFLPTAATDPSLAQAIGTFEGVARAGSSVFLGVLAIVVSRFAGHTRTVRVLSSEPRPTTR